MNNIFFDVTNGTLGIEEKSAVIGRPGALDFSTVAIGDPGSQRVATIENTGPDAVQVGAVSVSGPDAAAFSVQADTCSGAALAPGDRCNVRVRFSPIREGHNMARLLVPSDQGGSPAGIVLHGNTP